MSFTNLVFAFAVPSSYLVTHLARSAVLPFASSKLAIFRHLAKFISVLARKTLHFWMLVSAASAGVAVNENASASARMRMDRFIECCSVRVRGSWTTIGTLG